MSLKKSLLAGLISACLALPAMSVHAEDDLQQLVDDLQALTDKSREQRAADRWLQNALEDLVGKYRFPWRNSLLTDNFSDGDFTQSPVWKVSSGEFWVDGRLGLRSQVRETEIAKAAPAQSQQRSDKDLGKALLGAFLQSALSPQNQQQASQPAEPQMETVPASIRTSLAIPTTFAVEALFAQNDRPGTKGRLEWLVMQDETGSNAYKLVVMTGDKPVIDVVRVRSGRESIVETAAATALNTGGEHAISWRQTADGSIEIYLDGTVLIKTSDKAFRYGFKYLGLVNRGGDFAVSAIEVMGG